MGIFKRITDSIIKQQVNQEVNKAVEQAEKKWIRISGPEGGTLNTSGHFQAVMNQYEGAGTEAYQRIIDVYGCVYLISNTIALTPLRIYKDVANKKTGKVEQVEQTSHPAYELFKKPNFQDSLFDIKEAISANLELTGNAYLLMTKEASKIESIYCLKSNKCKPIPIKDKDLAGTLRVIKELKDMISGYSYGQADKKVYEVEDVIHEKKFNPCDDYEGLSPIKAGALSVDTINEARKQNFNIFRNGMRPDGAISTDQQLSQTVYDRLIADFEAKYKGTNNAHKPMILEQGLKYSSIALSQKDLEFILGLKMTREEICGFLFQVPLILLGVLENASYNNIVEATKIFYNFSIIPRLVKNQELWQKLVDTYEVEGCYAEYDLSNIEALKENITAKIDNYIKLVSQGRIPPNMAAKLVGLNLEDIPDGDIVYVPFNLVPAGSEPEEEAEEPAPGKSVKTIKQLTPELKEIKWKIFAEITGRIEGKYKKILAAFFKEQETEVLERLSKYKSMSYQKIAEKTYLIYTEDENGKKEAVNINSVLINPDKEAKQLSKESLPIHRESVEKTGQAEIELLNLGIEFDVTNPRVVAFLKKYGLDKATLVNESLKDKLKAQLIAGINEGESIAQITARLKETYSGYTTPQGYELERIARTEVIGASNEGALESYRQSNVVAKKGWLAAIDERTRDTHIDADRRYSKSGIPIDDDFEVGGENLPAPGQGNLPENNINCRCSIFPIVEE